MPEDKRHYGRWSKEELYRAEAAARRFLEENSTQIAATVQGKARILEYWIEQLSFKETSFQDRLEYFAHASEVARLIQADADGIFDLASQPTVARILGAVPPGQI